MLKRSRAGSPGFRLLLLFLRDDRRHNTPHAKKTLAHSTSDFSIKKLILKHKHIYFYTSPTFYTS